MAEERVPVALPVTDDMCEAVVSVCNAASFVAMHPSVMNAFFVWSLQLARDDAPLLSARELQEMLKTHIQHVTVAHMRETDAISTPSMN